ncbi:hypothetical protein OG285_05625 [Streptomyces sp. NBC_01471]|uniref:hypothetical protein n=1 Tax=Streptomyces sp. NBC_01471 TaxID=2903879 RepID=UPI003246D1E3
MIIVIIVVAVLMTLHGVPRQETGAVLGGASLLGLLLIRNAQASPRATVLIRRLGRALLTPALG